MAAPEPMLSTPGTHWPHGNEWVLQAKWDGFRLLVEIPRAGALHAWSRHGASLSERLPDLLQPFRALPPATVIDGELVALADCAGRPVQDFTAVRRAVFNADPKAADKLRFVAFDLLALDGADLRTRPWQDRDRQLRAVLPRCEVVRLVDSHPASKAAHDAIVSLGFEGTVIKRRRSLYRPGHQSAWQKHKARHTTDATLVSLRADRHGRPWAVCDVDGHWGIASANGVAADAIGRAVHITYSRTDADGGLREARVS